MNYVGTPPTHEATDRDWRVIVLGTLSASVGRIGDSELLRIQEWEHHACIDSVLLTMVRDGRVAVRWPEGETEPTFSNIYPAEREEIIRIATTTPSAGHGADK